MNVKRNRKTVFIDARLVCDRGKLDAQRLAQYFTKNGYEIVQHPRKADVIIFNGCGFSKGIVQTGLQEIEQYKKFNGELIVIGGLPDADKEICQHMPSGKFLSHKNLGNIDLFFPTHAVHFSDIEDAHHPWLTLDKTTMRTQIKSLCYQSSLLKKVFVTPLDYYLRHKIGEHYLILGNPFDFPSDEIYRLRISWGCTFHCSYCAIRNATGNHQSKPFEQCVKEFSSGLRDGFQTFHVMSVDPGGYGRDIGSTYPSLLRALCEFEGGYQFRLEALNPAWLITYQKELEDIVNQGRICAVSVPFQSGSRRILQLMNRFSDTRKIMDALQRLKTISPEITIATNCILGFPTETNEEFLETLEFITKAEIDMGIIYPISLKPGSKAEMIHPHVSDDEIHRRIITARTYLSEEGYHLFTLPGNGIIFGRHN
jgi:tRNA A37 methylthiotransferase MiaB